MEGFGRKHQLFHGEVLAIGLGQKRKQCVEAVFLGWWEVLQEQAAIVSGTSSRCLKAAGRHTWPGGCG